MKFSQFLQLKYLDWQQQEGRRRTVKEFAAYLGFATSTISTWWNDPEKVPDNESLEKLAIKLGIEVYDALDLPRPDPDLLAIQRAWHQLDTKTRTALREQAQKYTAIKKHPER
jgi:transcriptional regulator with XRE-family HTH domain